MIVFILIGGCFLALMFWVLDGIYQRIKSKDPKGNYQILAEIQKLNAEIYEKKYMSRKGILGCCDKQSVLDKENEIEELINKLK